MRRRELIRLAKQYLKQRPGAAEGLWNFWLKNDDTLHAEYQIGQGADIQIRKQNGGLWVEYAIDCEKDSECLRGAEL